MILCYVFVSAYTVLAAGRNVEMQIDCSKFEARQQTLLRLARTVADACNEQNASYPLDLRCPQDMCPAVSDSITSDAISIELQTNLPLGEANSRYAAVEVALGKIFTHVQTQRVCVDATSTPVFVALAQNVYARICEANENGEFVASTRISQMTACEREKLYDTLNKQFESRVSSLCRAQNEARRASNEWSCKNDGCPDTLFLSSADSETSVRVGVRYYPAIAVSEIFVNANFSFGKQPSRAGICWAPSLTELAKSFRNHLWMELNLFMQTHDDCSNP